jgi:hypothetical protein
MTQTDAHVDPVRVARRWYADKFVCNEEVVMSGKEDRTPYLAGAIAGARAMQAATAGGAVKVKDWLQVARLAGEHGIRYRTNRALERFLSDTLSALEPATATEQEGAASPGKWDHRYRPLATGEIIEAGDECLTDSHLGWHPAKHCIGEPAPDPAYTSHRMYRRLKQPTPAPEPGSVEGPVAPDLDKFYDREAIRGKLNKLASDIAHSALKISWWNTETAARRVAEEAAEWIFHLFKENKDQSLALTTLQQQLAAKDAEASFWERAYSRRTGQAIEARARATAAEAECAKLREALGLARPHVANAAARNQFARGRLERIDALAAKSAGGGE